ncbi:MAG: hypothetical protein LBJ63_09450 [Prevotellaceae bacterium]|jgi:hypothetical protein|nr:hypothetical protein [Prevotellaceae bacterium]
MKRYLMTALMAAMTLLAITACRSSKGTASSVSVTDKKEMPRQFDVPAEVEITFPCSGIDSDENFFRVNGMGKSKDRTMAKDRAYLGALANLASKLESVAAMINRRLGVSTNADGEEFHNKVVAASKLTANANVSGYRTTCEKYTQTPGDPSYNCYVTIEFGKQKMVKQLYYALNREKLLKADYDFDRYMKEFDEDLKEYEKSRK